MDAVEVLEDDDRPASPVVEEETTTLASPLESQLHDTLHGLVAGDLAALPVFVPLLFAYFDEGMRPGMGSAELAAHLSRKAGVVLGTLFKAAAEAEEKKEAAAPAFQSRALDFAMGACVSTPAWKLGALYAIDTVARPTDMSLVSLCVALAVCVWHWTDALVFAAIFWARRAKYASLEAGLVVCAAGAVCTLVG